VTLSRGKGRDREGTWGDRNAATRKVLGKDLLKALRATHSQCRGRGFESHHLHRMEDLVRVFSTKKRYDGFVEVVACGVDLTVRARLYECRCRHCKTGWRCTRGHSCHCVCGRPWLPFASLSQSKSGHTHGPHLIGLPSPEVRLPVVIAGPCSGEIRCARLSLRELGQTGLRGHLAGVDR
jgi:hypothetical protein